MRACMTDVGMHPIDTRTATTKMVGGTETAACGLVAVTTRA
jgi:hypothetical protein